MSTSGFRTYTIKVHQINKDADESENLKRIINTSPERKTTQLNAAEVKREEE